MIAHAVIHPDMPACTLHIGTMITVHDLGQDWHGASGHAGKGCSANTQKNSTISTLNARDRAMWGRKRFSMIRIPTPDCSKENSG